jgi:hypothetical protein
VEEFGEAGFDILEGLTAHDLTAVQTRSTRGRVPAREH